MSFGRGCRQRLLSFLFSFPLHELDTLFLTPLAGLASRQCHTSRFSKRPWWLWFSSTLQEITTLKSSDTNVSSRYQLWDIWLLFNVAFFFRFQVLNMSLPFGQHKGTGVTFAPTSESHSPLPKLGSHSPLPQWESSGITTTWCQINQPPFNNYIHFLSNLVLTLWHDSCHSTASHLFVASCSQQPFRVYWGGGEHSTYIIRFEALCSQQPFWVYCGGGEGGTFYLHHPLCCCIR